MGCVSSAEKRSDQQIKSLVTTVDQDEEKIIKMLLIGAGSTGKKTLFKSATSYHTEHDKLMSDIRGQKESIWGDITDSIKILLSNCDTLYEKDPILYNDCHFIPDSNSQQVIDSFKELMQYQDFENPSHCSDDTLRSIGEWVEYIWNLDFIKATYKHRHNNFEINDNLEHFCDKSRSTSIFSNDYVPTKQDYLLVKIMSFGMLQRQYSVSKSYHDQLQTPNQHTRFQLMVFCGKRILLDKFLKTSRCINKFCLFLFSMFAIHIYLCMYIC